MDVFAGLNATFVGNEKSFAVLFCRKKQDVENFVQHLDKEMLRASVLGAAGQSEHSSHLKGTAIDQQLG